MPLFVEFRNVIFPPRIISYYKATFDIALYYFNVYVDSGVNKWNKKVRGSLFFNRCYFQFLFCSQEAWRFLQKVMMSESSIHSSPICLFISHIQYLAKDLEGFTWNFILGKALKCSCYQHIHIFVRTFKGMLIVNIGSYKSSYIYSKCRLSCTQNHLMQICWTCEDFKSYTFFFFDKEDKFY